MGNARFGVCVTVAIPTLLLSSIIFFAPLADAQTYVEGPITTGESWILTGSPYIAIGDIYVKDSGSLAIQSGVEVLFNDSFGLFVENTLGAFDVLFNQNGTSAIPWWGIQFNSSSSSSFILDSNITASYIGVFINGTPDPPILDRTAIFGADIGLMVNESDPTIRHLEVNSSTLYSVIGSSSDFLLENSTLSGASIDFFLDNSSHATTLSTTFQGDISIVDPASDLTVKNFLHVRVLNETLFPLEGVDIEVTDIPPSLLGQPVYRTAYFGGPDPKTDSLGEASWIVVTDRIYSSVGESDNQTKIEVYYPGKIFENNPRYIPMNSSHTETFVAISPTEPPRVIDWSPDGSVPVTVDTPITVSFSKSMNRTSVEEAFEYTDAGVVRNQGHGEFAWPMNYSFTFTPDESYACCTRYNATLLSSTAKDVFGLYLDGDSDGTMGPDFSWNFTTEPGPPPEVSSTRPTNGEQFVSISANIIVIFDRPMNKSSVSAAFSYSDGIDVWNGSHGEITWDSTNHISDTMVFNPFVNLQTNTNYNVTINGSIAKDNCDSYLLGGANYAWNFTTEPLDDDPPQVVEHIPESGETDVDAMTIIQIRFNENMDTDSVNDSFSYTDSTTMWDKSGCNLTWNRGKDVLTCVPKPALYYGRTYTVTLDGSVAMDESGNHLDGDNNGIGGDDYNWSFVIETIPDDIPPTVVSNSPAGNQVPVMENIIVGFSELMDENSVQGAFYYTDGITIWQEGDGTFDWNGAEMTFIPDFDLDYATEYTVTITQSAMDRTGNHLSEDYIWTFTTETGIGTIFGQVRDENGVALADVKITILELDNTVHTSSNGSYVFEDIPAGDHKIRFSKEGFNTVTKSVHLEPNQSIDVSVRLTHSLTLLDLWWMILIIAVLVIILIILLLRRRKKAEEWVGAEDIAYVEPPEEPPE